MAVGTLSVMAALGVAMAADAQTGATQYGGSITSGKPSNTVAIGLARAADGRVAARLTFSVRCRGVLYLGAVIKAHGTSSGASFRFSGHTKVGGSRLSMTGRGTFAGTAATGRLSAHGKGCAQLRRAPFSLRAAALPGGPPAVPAKGTKMYGVTSQSAGGVRLPVALYVFRANLVVANWASLATCAGGRQPVNNFTPATQIHADGSFSRSEKYVIKYSDGSHDTFHVTFAGQFVSGGASGTLTARVHFTGKHGHHFKPCVTGTQTWTATP